MRARAHGTPRENRAAPPAREPGPDNVLRWSWSFFPRPKPTIEKTGCREKLARYLSPQGKFSGKGVEVVTALPGAPALGLLQPEAHRNGERHRPAGRRRGKRRGAMDHLPDLLVEACDAAAAHQRGRGHAAGAVEAEGDAC